LRPIPRLGSTELPKRTKRTENADSETSNPFKNETTTKNTIVKNIAKQIQHSNYQKDATDLKGYSSPTSDKKQNNHNDKNKNLSVRTNSDAFSWRKKSNDQNSGVNSVNGSDTKKIC